MTNNKLETIEASIAAINTGKGDLARVELYGDYEIKRWHQAGLVTIHLTPEATKKGKVIHDGMRGKWTSISEALKIIDKLDGILRGKHAPHSKTVFDSRGSEWLNTEYNNNYKNKE
jgi:hypothetical protein